MKKLIRRLFILAAVLITFTAGAAVWALWYFTSYGSVVGSVVVDDQAGNPVAGVEIGTKSLSIGGYAGVTDARGRATFPLLTTWQETKWISFSKPGYDPIEVEVPSRWPLYITLAPAGTGAQSVQWSPRH